MKPGSPLRQGQHLKAFYASLYYAALRPSEAVMLRESIVAGLHTLPGGPR